MNRYTGIFLGTTMFLLGAITGAVLSSKEDCYDSFHHSGYADDYYGPLDVTDAEEESMYGSEDDIPF